MSTENKPAADQTDAVEEELREHLRMIRDEPVPPDLEELAGELQRRLDQKQDRG